MSANAAETRTFLVAVETSEVEAVLPLLSERTVLASKANVVVEVMQEVQRTARRVPKRVMVKCLYNEK